jgi:type IV pilus assembly protein PilE
MARQQKGFTLIELIVAMMVAAILVSIAIPSYSSYVRKSRRTDAKTAVLDLASLEERYFSTANAYTNDSTNLGYGAGNFWPYSVGGGYYNVQIPQLVAATATTPAKYTITAVATGNQTNDSQCASFTVTSQGAQSALDSSNNDSTATCWR